MADERWLDDEEMRVWRAFVTSSVRLFEQLDRELKAEHALSHNDYAILANLADAPGQRLRMTELADRVLESKSRLSHHVNRLEHDGLVRRETCPSDRRGLFAVLSPAGEARLRDAAPAHVRSVRRHFIDRLDRPQLRTLADALDAVAEPLSPAGGPAAEPAPEPSHKDHRRTGDPPAQRSEPRRSPVR